MSKDAPDEDDGEEEEDSDEEEEEEESNDDDDREEDDANDDDEDGDDADDEDRQSSSQGDEDSLKEAGSLVDARSLAGERPPSDASEGETEFLRKIPVPTPIVHTVKMIEMDNFELGESRRLSIMGDLKKQKRMSSMRQTGILTTVPQGCCDELSDEEEETDEDKKKNLAPILTVREMSDYREIFELVDTDHGGSIDPGELGDLMRIVGMRPTTEQLDVIVQEVSSTKLSRKATGVYPRSDPPPHAASYTA